MPIFHTTLLDSPEELKSLIEDPGLNAVVLSLDIAPAANQLDMLQQVREIDRDVVLFAVSRNPSVELRDKAKALAVEGFFTAPLEYQHLQVLLRSALERRRAEIQERELRTAIAARNSFCDLVGGSEPMRRVYEAITRVTASGTTVLIRGESGTGKELVARAIVAAGPRRDKPFISLNCAALPEHLIEAELFGHEKGAFTGAHIARAGHIELAHTGTLFLDEIATLSLALQTKLLRVIEDRAVTRIGGKIAKKSEFRLITATNEPLEQMVRSGRFREDLYYRINVVPIALPPLRERRSDLPLLVDHFLRIHCTANGVPLKQIDPEVFEVLEEQSWPGNVRELENLIQRLVIMSAGPTIQVSDLPQQLLMVSARQQESLLIPKEGIDFEEEMARIEVAYLRAALRRTKGKKAAAAALLRLNPQQMKYLCRKYQIRDEDEGQNLTDEEKN